MEGLVALSLACNVFQVISFAHEIYDVSKRIIEDGSPDPTALDISSRLADLSQNLEDTIKADPQPVREVSELL
jgi:hypothetical protein